jgi:hypothetical protein
LTFYLLLIRVAAIMKRLIALLLCVSLSIFTAARAMKPSHMLNTIAKTAQEKPAGAAEEDSDEETASTDDDSMEDASDDEGEDMSGDDSEDDEGDADTGDDDGGDDGRDGSD